MISKFKIILFDTTYRSQNTVKKYFFNQILKNESKTFKIEKKGN